MRAEAYEIVQASADDVPLLEARTAYMRYIGQGHEITVPLEARPLTLADRETLREAFETEYRGQFGRVIPGLEAEVLSWSVSVSTESERPTTVGEAAVREAPSAGDTRRLFEPKTGEFITAAVYRRAELAPGMRINGPALIVEDDTTTVVSPAFEAMVNALGYLVLNRKQQEHTA